MTETTTRPENAEQRPELTEYAVSHTPIGATEPTLIRCGDDDALMRQRLFEILEQGGKAQPVTRPAVEWTVDDAALATVKRDVARAAVIAIAQDFWDGEIDLNKAVDELEQHSPHDFVTRTTLLDELVSELGYQENVEEDKIAPGDGEDKQTLLDDAERRINEAADRLIGNPA